MLEWIKNMTENICKAYNCDFDYNYEYFLGPTINNEKATKLARKSLIKLIGEENMT